MTKTVELDVAQVTLSELIAGLKPAEEVVIVQNQKSLARIVAAKRGTPQFGNCKGMLRAVLLAVRIRFRLPLSHG